MKFEYVNGGVCAAKGFSAAGIHCGVRASREKKDLALIYSQVPCNAAGLFTKNKVKAAPVLLDIRTLEGGSAQAIVANSGNANACAPDSNENAHRMQAAASNALGLPADKVLIGSTGVIGQRLNIEVIESGLPLAVRALRADSAASDAAAQAIMTTDTVKKEFAVSIALSGKTVTLGGISKGSGMIHPNMGTMLCYLTTDCNISPFMLKKALLDACDVTFNRVSVDGDTSTNDSLIILANGMAENPLIDCECGDYEVFAEALRVLCTAHARAIAADGEGAKHLITCTVSGTYTEAEAEALAMSVISSPLTKAAIFGCDANWGRVLCAMGYSGVDFDPEGVRIVFSSGAGSVTVCENGMGLDFDEALAKKILQEPEVNISADLGQGLASATCWGCDLTYDYVRINGDYRS